MAETDPRGGSTADTLRDRVMEPLATAERTIEREYDQVESERRAFERFRERIAAVDPVSTPSSPQTMRTLAGNGRTCRVEQIRTAFRETVMSVPHYDDVHGEPLDVHFASEFSVEVAVGIQRDGQPFTASHKGALIAAIDRAVGRREGFCDALDDEVESLETGRERLRDVLDDLEGRPDGERTPDDDRSLPDRLDEIARTRQESLRTRTSLSRADAHDTCSYLYREAPWTYPLLTAVTRFRDAVE